MYDSNLSPEENLEPYIAGLKRSRIKELWHKALEKEHAAQVKEWSLPLHILCPEELPENFL